MSFRVTILRRAQNELADIPLESYSRVRDAIKSLGDEPRPRGCVKLRGRPGWRIRISRYRVIYEVYDVQCTVRVMHVGHRKDVYK